MTDFREKLETQFKYITDFYVNQQFPVNATHSEIYECLQHRDEFRLLLQKITNILKKSESHELTEIKEEYEKRYEEFMKPITK